MKKFMISVFVFVFLFSGVGYATLHDRGGGLIYDDVLKITWLQDANYALTTGYGGWDGRMSWYDAMTWVDHLEYGGYEDWRLPKTLPVDGVSYDYDYLYDGSSDRGFNISAPGTIYEESTSSELAYMYYNNLNNLGKYDTNGDEQDNWGLQNTGLFTNVMPTCNYWSATNYEPVAAYAWAFDFGDGDQGYAIKNTINSYVWVVRDGDVAPVPEPATMFLLGSGLVGLARFRKKIKK